MNKKLAQDASASIAGIIYQYYLAVEWCFRLDTNQSLLIEKDGDIAMSDEANVEVKHFSDPLTDSHKNIWNTLANWLEPSFDTSKYPKLILITTQKISTNSQLLDWKDKSITERIDIIDKILSRTTLNDKQEKVKSYRLEQKFKEVISKFEIYDSSSAIPEKYYSIANEYCKAVPSNNRGRVLNGLLGLLISPDIVGNQWEISERSFSDEFALLNEKFRQSTRVFPKKPDPDQYTVNSPQDSLYLQKIRDIEYLSELNLAHSSYCEALTVINEEFQFGTKLEYFDSYQEEIIGIFERKQKKASKKVTEPILDSQDFYDEVMGEEGPELESYPKRPYRWFRDGILHINMDDVNKNLKWKLK
ncbi:MULTISPECIES: hypothetical protein [Pseudoalteromonas]|uniref:hypothetical protein n=1 Tax=Pseudoalteromonas TaxID=53246 RepID=UPI000580164F|nr:hypothetical protein [Pseudoalteromonas flavipulchra]KID38842.1 hypothetical protein QT15_02720 [Pseudoalteromonas flavipulchra NCIMB 2033 = ATCC BAA-314]MBD0783606.1 hypothetical protein [Pseudoalteromonas flavipulchra]MBE0375074.1 hypothetical protein [Pseudoalteromonas flavipulchra NCIMB 2033 = ATCC BAA-314]